MQRRALYISLLLFLVVTVVSHGQVRITANTLYGNNGARITIATTGNVRIDQAMSLGNTVLGMAGSTQNLQATGTLTLLGLGITNGTDIRMSGNLTVTGNIAFEDGTITPGTGKLLYTGPEILTGNASSYVKGMLWSKGTGVRSYPIASSDNIYAPFVLQGVSDAAVELGVEAVHSNPGVINIPATIPDVSSNWYWEVSSSGGTFSGAVATLPILVGDEDLFTGQNVSGVVLQSNGGRDLVESLGGSVGIDAVTSASPGVGPLFFLGTILDVQLSIHNIISPNGDGINDYLVVENLGLLGLNNTVTLLDRWGVKVYHKQGFQNFDAISNPYDGSFDFLQPGTYIAIVQIPDRETMTQTITVVRE